MKNDFDKAFAIIVGEEGGYSNDPRDPGGETNYGVTKSTLLSAIEAGLLPVGTTVKGLTIEQAKIVYNAFYWVKIKGDILPWPLCLFIFDSAINQGVDSAIKLLQKTVGTAQDGIFGIQTQNAAAKFSQFDCAEFMANRALRYMGTRNFDVYGRGWLIRLFEVTMKGMKNDTN